MLDRFKKAAEKAGVQATAFMRDSQSRVAAESRGFVQSFSLPGEADKCAKILESFLGTLSAFMHQYLAHRAS